MHYPVTLKGVAVKKKKKIEKKEEKMVVNEILYVLSVHVRTVVNLGECKRMN